MNVEKFTVHMPHKIALGATALLLLMSLSFAVLVNWPIAILMMCLSVVAYLASYVLAHYINEISIDDDRIVLYKFNSAPWHEFVDAKPFSILGLKYLRLDRMSNVPLFMPLYVSGPRPILESVLHHAPKESKVAKSVSSLLTGPSVD